MAKKIVASWCFGIVIALYTTFVLQNLWNWFAVSAFHISEISFWVMYGLVLTIGVLTDKEDMTSHQLKGLYTMVEALEVLLPPEEREELDKKFKEQTVGFGFWLEVGSRIVGRVVGNTLILVLGWTIHTFLT